MGIVNKFISVLKGINFKTIYFNFTYLPFKQAILLPIAVSRHVFLLKTKGKIIIEMPVRPGIIKIGYKGVGLFDHKRSRSIWEVSGTVIFKGKTFI